MSAFALSIQTGSADEYRGSLKDGPAIIEGYNWSGLYVGANVGFSESRTDVDLSHSTGAIFYNDPFVPSAGHLGSDDSVVGGVEVGFNHQFNSIVVGVAADVSWTDTENEGTFTTPLGSQWNIKSSPDIFGTVRGKAGVLVRPDLLIYATGGLAWGQFDVKQATTFVEGSGCSVDCEGSRTSGNFNHLGFVVGGGLEWALTQHWSLKAEYLFLDFGSEDYQLQGTTKPGGNVPYVETFSADQQMHIGRAGINYRF
ncbi:outer membrane protein [Hyphomicrobium sp.]|uniref:outer membrane protein n=1 Tax=Hyphomicrobium sp. TaxID=82 RepID=UPI002D766E8A|nr:outer membrane beta-barrel protein [Hyphomicrobium sp.]HET6388852.1 outer membrane beta-barrel protein [Hyphomicrobium sp.]